MLCCTAKMSHIRHLKPQSSVEPELTITLADAALWRRYLDVWHGARRPFLQRAMFLKPQPNDSQFSSASTAPARGPENLAMLFERQCEAHPEALAYCFLADPSQPSKTLSYGQLRQEARRIAAWLADQTQVGDRVLLAFAPGLDFACAFWACLLAGRVAVPVPAPDRVRLHRSGPRLRSLIADSRATLVLTSATMLDGAVAVLDPELFAMTRWTALPEPAAQAVSATGFVPPVIDAASVAYLQYTSGSTSRPEA